MRVLLAGVLEASNHHGASQIGNGVRVACGIPYGATPAMIENILADVIG